MFGTKFLSKGWLIEKAKKAEDYTTRQEREWIEYEVNSMIRLARKAANAGHHSCSKEYQFYNEGYSLIDAVVDGLAKLTDAKVEIYEGRALYRTIKLSWHEED